MTVTVKGPQSSECTEGDDGTITYVVPWLVTTNDRNDGARAVLNASGLPKRGDFYSFGGDSDSFASCRSRSARLMSEKDTLKSWIVTCNYSTAGSRDNPQNNGGGPTDPINWDWRCRLSSWQRQEAPDKDRNGRAFVNVCNEPFLPPPERAIDYPLVLLERNSPTLPLLGWAEAIGKVNSGSLWGLDARRIKLKKWDVDPHWISSGMMYWSYRIECEVKFDGYYFQPPNLGYFEKTGIDPATNKPEYDVIRDKNFIPLARPVPLAADGTRLAEGVDVLYFDQADDPLERFEIEDEFDFSQYLPPALPGNFS